MQSSRGHGGWNIFTLWGSSRPRKIFRAKSVNCTVQGRLGATTTQFGGSRKAVGLTNCAEQWP